MSLRVSYIFVSRSVAVLLSCRGCIFLSILFFFFNDTATTEIYTLSLHDALPIWKAMKSRVAIIAPSPRGCHRRRQGGPGAFDEDRKSTRLNSSHLVISYAVFCLKKKNTESSLLRVRIVFQLVILEKDRASRR